MTAPIHLHKPNSLAAFMAEARWEHDPKDAALFALSHLEPPPICLTCGQAVEKPATVGWTDTTTFVICSDCADDDELEQRVLERLTAPETSGAADGPPVEAEAAWIEAAAKAWARPPQA
jgi:hypothetical protein